MSTVSESRVVEMRFDNKEFEQGARETLNTLEELKRALEENISGEAFIELDRAARSVDLSGIQSGIETLTDRFSTMGIVGMTVIQNITNALTNTLGNAVNSLFDSITSGGLRRAQNIENARFQLQGILGDAEKVAEVMDNASASVDGTAYALDSAAKAASQLAASGVEAGEQMTSVLKGIAGVAATTSTDYEGVSRIFTQIAGQGRLMGDQLLQLSNRGLNAAATLTNYINGVKNGTIDTTDAIKEQISALTGATSLVTSSAEAVQEASADIIENAKKAANEEYKALQKSYKNEYKALQKSLNEEYNLKKKAYDEEYKLLQTALNKQYKELQDSLNKEVEAVQEANQKRIEDAQEKYQQDVEAYRKATDERIALINEEYKESIKLIDEEKYEKLKAVDDKIKAIQDQAKAEQKAIEDAANEEKRTYLENAKLQAKGSVTRKKAEEALAEFEAELERKRLAEERQNQIDELQNEKESIRDEYAKKKEEAQEKAQAAREAVQEESSAELKAMQKAHQQNLKEIRKEQAEQIAAMREANAERLSALRESQNEELQTLRESQTEQLSIVKEAQSARLEAQSEANQAALESFRETQNEELEALSDSLQQSSGKAAKWASKFGGIMDLTEADLREMVSDGVISFDLFSEAMAKTFGDHAYDANKTFQGALSNVRAALARTGAMFYQPILQEGAPAIALLNAIRTKINEVNKVLQPIADIVTGAINDWIPGLTKKINDLYISLSYTNHEGTELENTVTLFGPIGQIIGNSLKSILNILSAIGSYIKPVVEAFREVFALDFGEIRKGSESFESFTKSLKASDKASNIIKSTFKAVFGVIKSLVDVVKGLFKAFSPLTQLFGVAGDSLGFLAKNIAEAINKFTTWLVTSERMQKIFSTLTGYVQSFVNIVKQIKGAVSDAFEATFSFVDLGSYFSEGFLKGMLSLIPDILKGVLDFGRRVLEAVRDIFIIRSPSKAMFEIGLNFMQGFINAIKYMVETVLTVIGNVFTTILNKVKEIISDVDFQEMVLNGLETARAYVDNVITGIKEKIPEAVQAVKDFFSSIADKIQEWRSGNDTGISFMRKFLEGCWSVLSEVLTGIGEIFGEIISSIREKFEDFSLKDAVITGGTFALNFVKGLKDKLVEISGNILDTLQNVFAPLSHAIPSLIVMAAGFGVLFGLVKLAKTLKGIVDPFKSIARAIGNLSEALKAYAFDLKATAILKISVALGVLVASIWGLAELINNYGVETILISATVLLTFAVALIAAFTKFTEAIAAAKTVETGLNAAASGLGKAFKRFAMGSLIKSFAKAIMTLVMSIAVLATMIATNADAVDQAVGYISLYIGIFVAIAAIVAIAEKFGLEISKGATLFNGIAKAVLALGISIRFIVSSLEDIMNLDLKEKEDNLKLLRNLIIGISAVIAVFVFVSALAGKLGDGNQATAPLMTLIGFAILLHTTIKELKKVLDLDLTGKEENLKLLKEIFIGIGVLVTIITAVSAIGDGGSKAGGTIIGMAVMLLAATLSIKSLVKTIESTKPGVMIGALVSLVVIILAMSFSFALMDGVKTDNWKSVLSMVAALGVIILGIGALSLIEPERLWPAAIGLMLCIAALGAAFYGAGQIKDNKGMAKMIALIGATIAIGVLLMKMSEFDWLGMIGSGVALSLVILAYGTAFQQIADVNPEWSAIGKFVAGASALLIIAGALAIAATQEWSSILAAGASISAVVLVYAEAFRLISDVSIETKTTLNFILGSLVLVVIGAVLAGVATRDWDSILAAGGAISAVLAVYTACFVAINKIDVSFESIGAFLAGIVGVIAIGLIIGELAQYDWKSLMGAALAIITTLIGMSVVLLLCSVVGKLGSAGLVGIEILDAFIADLGVVIAALGALTKIDGFTELMAAGGGVLVQIGTALGNFVGSIVEGALVKITEAFPKIGMNLSLFMVTAKPFFDGLKGIDNGTAEGAKSIAGIILALGAAELMDAVTNFLSIFTGNKDSFGEKLAAFGTSIADFAKNTKGVNGENLKTVAEGGKALIEMANAIPNEGGLLAKIVGDNDIALFGAKLVSFSLSLKDVAKNLSGVNVDRFPEIAESMKSMITMATSIPNSGGWLGAIVGNNDIDDFGLRLASFSMCLMLVDQNLKGVPVNKVKFQNIADAMDIMSSMATKLPNSGGWLGKIVGNNDIDDFGQKLVSFSTSLRIVSITLTGVNTDQISNIAEAMKDMIGVASKIKEEKLADGGWIKDSTLEKFGKNLVAFGEQIRILVNDKLPQIERLNILTTNLQSFMLLVPMLNTFTGTSFITFLNNLATYGAEGLQKFCDAFSGSKEKIVTAVSTMFSNLGSTITSKKDLLEGYGRITSKYLISGIEEGIKDIATISILIGAQLSSSIGKGLEESVSQVSRSISHMLTLSVSMLRNDKSMFNAGKELAERFAFGITSNTMTVIRALNLMLLQVTSMMKVNTLSFTDAGKESAFRYGLGFTTNTSKVIVSVKFMLLEVLAFIRNNDKNFTEVGKESALRYGMGFMLNSSKVIASIEITLLESIAFLIAKSKKFIEPGNFSALMFSKGFYDNHGEILNTVETIIRKATELIRNSNKFYEAGKYVVEGFVRGIRNNMRDAESAGRDLGNAAYNAARRSLDEHSPSRKMGEVGSFAGEGFVQGFADWIKAAAKTGTEVGESAQEGLMDAISNIAKDIQNEEDFTPIITPVLDLSNVEANAKELGGILNLDKPLQLAANAGMSFTGGLGSLLNNIQASIPDSTNDDVVTAINDLRSDISILGNKVASMQVVMDTGELVGVLTDPIDYNLGFNAVLNKRRVK